MLWIELCRAGVLQWASLSLPKVCVAQGAGWCLCVFWEKHTSSVSIGGALVSLGQTSQARPPACCSAKGRRFDPGPPQRDPDTRELIKQELGCTRTREFLLENLLAGRCHNVVLNVPVIQALCVPWRLRQSVERQGFSVGSLGRNQVLSV